ncbi:hypothetical protein L208DRAFT_466513 [Tricholoma matsutake]|nr:hypothetical protein L208DRAFT_466513 [Tricholoma matsutake 945]
MGEDDNSNNKRGVTMTRRKGDTTMQGAQGVFFLYFFLSLLQPLLHMVGRVNLALVTSFPPCTIAGGLI